MLPFHPFPELALPVSDCRPVLGRRKKVSKYEGQQDIRDIDKQQKWGKYKIMERRDVHDKDKENFQTNMREFLDERQRQRLEKI